MFRKKIEYKFKDSGYERHLIEMLEKEILIQNPNVKWGDIAGRNRFVSHKYHYLKPVFRILNNH